jgi:transposase
MFIREVRGKNKTYLSLVEGYRENGQVKQRTLLSFGSVESLNEEEIFAFTSKLLSYCKTNSLVDISNAEEKRRLNWGLPAVINRLWSLFSFDQFFTIILQKRKIQFKLTACVKLMLIDRFFFPRSKLQTYNHKGYYLGFDSSDITLQHLYRTLSFLSSQKDAIEKHIYDENRRLFGMPVEVVFFDVSTLYFESTKADDLKDFGYSKDAKFNEVQVVLSMLINKEGRPVGFDLFQGNTYEGHTLIDAIVKVKDKYGIKKAIIVADRGINSGVNLQKIKESGCEYIMGCRFKSGSASMKQQVLDIEEYINIDLGEGNEVLKYRIFNHQKIVKDNGQKIGVIDERIVCTWSSKRAKKDKKDRERLVAKAKAMVLSNEIENKRGAKKYIIAKAKEPLILNENKIEKDEMWDGFYAIETSHDSLSAREVMDAYHELWRIEESFRLIKSHFETRPIFHWTPSRIKGHFILSYILFLFERTLELELRKIGESPISPGAIRESLSMMELSEIYIGGNNNYQMRAPINELGGKIIEILGITVPKKLAAV